MMQNLQSNFQVALRFVFVPLVCVFFVVLPKRVFSVFLVSFVKFLWPFSVADVACNPCERARAHAFLCVRHQRLRMCFALLCPLIII